MLFPHPHKIFLLILFFDAVSPITAQNSADWYDLNKFEAFVEQETNLYNFHDFGVVDFVKAADHTENRLIEPTSPILGKNLVQYIKTHPGRPEEILNELSAQFDQLEKELIISSIAYFNTLMPGLKLYCQKDKHSTSRPDGKPWTQLEISAIPLEVLTPLHPVYQSHMSTAEQYYKHNGLQIASDSAKTIAELFQETKNSCPSVVKILRKDNHKSKVLPTRIRHLLRINAEISSAEAAYPRLQYSINGYLQHIYQCLLDHEDLFNLLKKTYEAQELWIEMAQKGQPRLPFLSFIEQYLVAAGFEYRDALLVLCYSTRNMPNLDVQYAGNLYQALALEIYFWKLKPLQNTVVEQHFNEIFPNYDFNKNPMLYHYMTASYLAYEIKKANYSGFTAVSMAFMSKAGYKIHKFFHAVDRGLLSREGMNGLMELTKKQSSKSGIQAGYYGGKHGVKLAKKEKKQKGELISPSIFIVEKTDIPAVDSW